MPRLIAALLAGLLIWLVAPPILACSNVFVTARDELFPHQIFAAVARSMDFEEITGNSFGYGLKGVQNVSNINMYPPVNPARWANVHAFAGQTAVYTSIMTDGVNNAGLYVGLLELPGVTKFPDYNPEDPRPELGVMNALIYALGTSASVADALDNLKENQLVINAGSILDVVFAGFPFHLSLRDKYGDSAVIEWVDGSTHYYYHQAFTDKVVLTIDRYPDFEISEFTNSQAAILTNAPPYDWHLTEAAKSPWMDMITGNTDQTWQADGKDLYMNGSRLVGLPGDFTSPSRFIRGSVLSRLMPAVKSQNQAMQAAFSILQSLQAPAGSSPDPTIWVSWVDLARGIYHFRPALYPVTISLGDDDDGVHESLQLIETPAQKEAPWQSVHVKSLKRVPPGGVTVRSRLGRQVPEVFKGIVETLIEQSTPGPSIVDVHFERNLKLRKGDDGPELGSRQPSAPSDCCQ